MPACTVSVEIPSGGVAQVPDLTGELTALDNKTPAHLLIIEQDPPAGTLVGVGAYIITTTITDQSGNQTTCTNVFCVTAEAGDVFLNTPQSFTATCDELTVEECAGGLVLFDDCYPYGYGCQDVNVLYDNCYPYGYGCGGGEESLFTGPLNSAVHEPGRNFIYAVRDNWVFKLSAVTGALVAESRFAYPGVGGDTYIDYDSTTDKLWSTYWRSTQDVNASDNAVRYLAEIDPDDLSVTLHALTGGMSPAAFSQWFHGPGQIITRSGVGWFLYASTATAFRSGIARVNLAVPSLTTTGSISGATSSTWTAIHHDGTTLIVGSNGDEDARQLNATTLALITTTGEGVLIFPYGITRDPTNGFAYFATATQVVVKAEVGGGLTSSTIDLLRSDANPHNIRYNATDQLIYVPLYRDDSVAVINPVDDSFTIKTGFTAPWDVVFTASRKFAVQHARQGLKEIT